MPNDDDVDNDDDDDDDENDDEDDEFPVVENVKFLGPEVILLNTLQLEELDVT